ncbi:MAG: hypothetical protein KGM96_02245 [Acidobacteriota bacterium]|nr:hypothetical protein [Acidobacteriota bacterium]
MNSEQERAKQAGQRAEMEAIDPELQQVLGDFKASVHAWSDAMVSRPRAARQTVAHRTWRLVAGGVLAAILIGGAVTGELYERHDRQVQQARIAAERKAEEQQRALEAQHAREEQDLLAKVDNDVSREVPSALEPLAYLMTDDPTR